VPGENPGVGGRGEKKKKKEGGKDGSSRGKEKKKEGFLPSNDGQGYWTMQVGKEEAFRMPFGTTPEEGNGGNLSQGGEKKKKKLGNLIKKEGRTTTGGVKCGLRQIMAQR